MTTTATLFTGGGGFDLGASLAGFTPTWGVEIRPDIAAVAEANICGLRVIVSDVAQVDYTSLEAPDHLHASPSCKNASNANSEGEEEQEDLSAALAICRALQALRPPFFTLENVWAYRNFESFKLIVKTLRGLGYLVDWWHLNSADYGVPQTRKRLILVARRDRKPQKPMQTHYKPDAVKRFKGMRSLFFQPWVGWLESIADLVDTLPDSEFAPWQLERLPEELRDMLVNSENQSRGLTMRESSRPAFSVVHGKGTYPRALLMPGSGNTNFNEAKPGKGARYEDEPATTVTTSTKDGGGIPRAYLIPANGEHSSGLREVEPAPVITTQFGPRARAWLAPGDNTTNGVIRREDEPMVTIQSRGLGQCPHRAYLVGSHYADSNDKEDRRPQSWTEAAPAFTVTVSTGTHNDSRAAVGGRVVKMTPRCLARFQSVPDWYQLPKNNGLACEIIGNAVPPLLAKAICESLRD